MRPWLAVAAVVLVTALSCGGGSPSSSTPVASTPLAGTVDGKPWTASQGRANPWNFDDGGERWLDISSAPLSCSQFFADAELIGTVPWHAGEAYDLGLQQNLTFVVKTDAGLQNYVATNGRVEVISAPDAGIGTVRIRAKFGSDFSVEGEVKLDVCP
jgi:hypothetical protein